MLTPGMEELTVRLGAETKQSLQAEAADRGVTVTEHVRDIIDAYQTSERIYERPEIEIEYVHAIRDVSSGAVSGTADRSDSERAEEIGSFTYGSRSKPV